MGETFISFKKVDSSRIQSMRPPSFFSSADRSGRAANRRRGFLIETAILSICADAEDHLPKQTLIASFLRTEQPFSKRLMVWPR